jgi:hypothetical protein
MRVAAWFAFALFASLFAVLSPGRALGSASASEIVAPQEDRAGRRLEQMIEDGDGWRTADGVWRLMPEGADPEFARGPTHVRVTVMHQSEALDRLTLPLENDEALRIGETAWPFIIRFAEPPADDQLAPSQALIGVQSHASAMYSGGGAQVTQLTLYLAQVSPIHQSALEVATLPMSGSVMIRACFSEEDYRVSGGACHDEYDFNATLALDRGYSGAMPRFRFVTDATSFPGRVGRFEDNSSAGAMARRRLAGRAIDTECSYRRTIAWNPAVSRYEFNRPAPACDDYLVP